MRKPVDPLIIKARALKAAATKLTKRITIKCAKCGKEWKEKPSHAWRKYCSNECAGNRLSHEVNRICVQCGNPFKTTWINRKKITCSRECGCAHQGATMAAMGHTPIKFRDEDKWLASLRTPERREETRQLHLGAVRSTPKSKRHSPNHIKAVEGFVRAPNNVIYHVRNVTAFVAANEHLFLPETVVWRATGKYLTSRQCSASYGLASIIRGHRMTWRGWQVVSGREGRERFDLIGRNFVATI